MLTVKSRVSISAGRLVLVPDVVKASAKSPQDEVKKEEITVSTPSDGEFACLDGIRFVLSPAFTKEMPCVAWAVQATEHERMANMTWSKMKISDVAVAEGPPERPRHTMKATECNAGSSVGSPLAGSAVSKARSLGLPVQPASAPSSSSSYAREITMEVPVMVNTRALAAEPQ